MDSTCVSGYEDVRRLNPFRYRGYYFDTETAFYYLQSRYYDPRTGRFINADSRLNANGDINKGILYGATAIGSLLGPHGAVVGFVLGGVICIVVDVLVSNEVDGLIDKIAK